MYNKSNLSPQREKIAKSNDVLPYVQNDDKTLHTRWPKYPVQLVLMVNALVGNL